MLANEAYIPVAFHFTVNSGQAGSRGLESQEMLPSLWDLTSIFRVSILGLPLYRYGDVMESHLILNMNPHQNTLLMEQG